MICAIRKRSNGANGAERRKTPAGGWFAPFSALKGSRERRKTPDPKARMAQRTAQNGAKEELWHRDGKLRRNRIDAESAYSFGNRAALAHVRRKGHADYTGSISGNSGQRGVRQVPGRLRSDQRGERGIDAVLDPASKCRHRPMISLPPCASTACAGMARPTRAGMTPPCDAFFARARADTVGTTVGGTPPAGRTNAGIAGGPNSRLDQ